MRISFTTVVALVAFAGAAYAADPLESYYGNTVVLSNPNSGEMHAFVNQDGTYQTKLADGSTVSGTWAINGDQACYTQTNPAPAADAKPFCAKAEAHNVGDSWQVAGADGTQTTITIKAGR
ncbi:MAG: hypothetical protein WBG82_10705 [Parvibaculum sp.]|uniref:hypothetical protein n=1 Tax=Parvibaculum sp. TaxID=2024848 RepID=UPI002BBAB536|nr:hypothetical protein [Parvibaculum sp.]HMM13820.1 hypothetical protein [Parvibaculum sp.]